MAQNVIRSDLMGLAIWFSDPPNTGVGRYNKNLLEAIPDAIPFHYIPAKGVYEQPYDRENRIVAPLKINLPKNAELIFNRYFQRRITKHEILKSTNIDMIHYTSQHESPFLDGSFLQIATILDLTALKERPVDFTDLIYKRLVKKNIDRIFELDRIVTISEYVKREILEYGYNGTVHMIHLCAASVFHQEADKRDLRERLGLPSDKILILSVSSGAKRKNLAMIIKTMKLLGDRYTLVRVGPALGIKNELDFPHVSDDTLNGLYNACDLLLFPSFDEGFGYPLAEAMTTGLPIVASDTIIHREILQDAGILVSKNDPKDYVEAINAVSKSPEKYSILSLQRSREFSFEKFAKEYGQFYYRLMFQ